MVLKVGDDIAALQANRVNTANSSSMLSVDSKPASHTGSYNNPILGDDEDDGDGTPVLELPDSIKNEFDFTAKVNGLTPEQRAALLDEDEGYDVDDAENAEDDLLAVDDAEAVDELSDNIACEIPDDNADQHDDYDVAYDTEAIVAGSEEDNTLDLLDQDDDEDADEEEEEDSDLDLFADEDEEEKNYEMPDMAAESPAPVYAEDNSDEDDDASDNYSAQPDDDEDEAVVLTDEPYEVQQNVEELANRLPRMSLSLSAGFFCSKKQLMDDLSMQVSCKPRLG